MTLTITLPVTGTCAPLPVSPPIHTLPTIQLPGTAEMPDAFDWRVNHTWVHPRGTHMHLVHHVAEVRGVELTSKSDGDGSKQSLPALVAACAPVAYLMTGVDQIKQDLYLRGPVSTTMQVTQHFCDYWSSLVRRSGAAAYSSSKEKTHHANVVVALLGWTKDDEWIVALPWGATTDAVQQYGHNGCCVVKMGVMGLADMCVGMLQVQPPVDHASVTMQVYKCTHPFALTPHKKPKVQVKAKVILAHGDKKGQHPKSMMQKVSAGDIASITFMALTIAVVAIFLCFSLTGRKRPPSGRRVKK